MAVGRSDGGREDPREDALGSIAAGMKGSVQTVESMVEGIVREAILRGVFEPGERLNQDAIAQTIGVSRMPVRAGLKQLESEGLVKILPHRGATVSVLRPEEIGEIYDLRVVLETYLLERAMANMTPLSLRELRKMSTRWSSVKDPAESLDRRKQFYERLYAMADRPRALAMAKQLRAAVGRYLLLVQVEGPHGHDDLLQHLESGDVDSARTWLTTHLCTVSTRLQALLARETEDSRPA